MFLSCFMSWHCGKITVIHKFLFCSLLKIAHSPVLSHTQTYICITVRRFAWFSFVNIFLFLVRIFWLRVPFCAVRGVQCVMSQFFCRIGKTHLAYVTVANGIALSLACSKLLHTFMDIVDTFSQKKSVFINGRTHVYLLYWFLYC